MNIHVGNLPPAVTDQDLKTFFEVFGKVESAQVITNVRTGEPQGYGFVIMASDEEAMETIATLNGKEWMGKTLVLSKAHRAPGKRSSKKGLKRPAR